MADISYDTLNIVITANSSNAQKSVKSLTNSLNALDETAKNIDKERILEVKELLLDISKIDFSNVSKGLKDVVSAFRTMQTKAFNKTALSGSLSDNKGSQNFELVGDSYTTGFEMIQQELVVVNNQLDLYNEKIKKGSESVEKQADIFKLLEQALKEAGFSSDQIKAVFSSIKTESKKFSAEQLQKLREILKQLGVSGKDAERVIKNLKTTMEKSGKGAEKGASGFSKFSKQFLNIAKYRLVRKLIQEIFNEVSNAMQSLAEYDQDFDKALGEIKSAFSFIARTLVSAIAPIIKEIAPLFTILAQSVGAVITAIGEGLASGLGQEQFSEAKESVESYTDSLKKAKSVSTGIDELNVISQEKSSDLFNTKEMKTNGEGFAKVFESLKPIIDKLTKEITEIVSALFDFLKEARPILEIIWGLVQETLELTSESVNGSIKDVLLSLASILNLLAPIITLLQPILTILNWINALIINITNWITSALSIAITNIFDLFSAIGETIVALLTGDFDAIDDIWNGLLQKMNARWLDFGKGIANFFINIWNKVVVFIQDTMNNLISGINGIAKFLGFSIPKVDYSSAIAPTFASGGFPQEDGLFFANHTELIGQFSNGQTAVANNEQIIEGIKQGVLEAMLQSGSGNINVLIDGYEVASIVEKRQNNSGMNLVYGGNINYGK